MRFGIGEKDECQGCGYSSVQDCWSNIGSGNETLISIKVKKKKNCKRLQCRANPLVS